MDIEALIKKYYELKPLSPEDTVKVLREILRRDIKKWQEIFESGCNDPAWTDGANLNLVRNHIIRDARHLSELGEDMSRVYIPPEVDDGLMIQAGKYFQLRCERFEQQGMKVKLEGAEIALF